MISLPAAVLLGLCVTSPLVSARPPPISGFKFPLSNGFPNPNDDALKQIEIQAGGTLPNGSPPPSISSDGLTNLKLIALNELFEVAYFSELLQNITNNVPGYEPIGGISKQFLVDTVKTVIAQEELHALNANGALKHFGASPIEPCTYNFPVTNLRDAIALAGTFTDVVLGTLQDVQFIFAEGNDNGLVRAVGSVIGQEGEQEGFYRLLQSKKPSESPFLTTGVRDFAFTAIQSFTVPGSCPNINTIPLKTFAPLTLLSKPGPGNQSLMFAVDLSTASLYDPRGLSLVYINQQNVPVVETIKVVRQQSTKVTFKAFFPQADLLMNGLTIAAVTSSQGPFASADDVAKATIFGPAFIEVN